jgi:PPOX class probable F420-dependent enzyme
MATIPPGARALIEAGAFGHVITLDPDGTPYVTLAWVAVDGDDLVWSTFYDQRKVANLRRDPRITISFQAREPDSGFLYPYLVAAGTATISEGGALEVMDRLAAAYTGADRFPNRDVPPGLTIRVHVERLYGTGTWREAAEEGATADR